MRTIKSLTILLAIAMLASCGSSVTNVWDYYIKNNMEQHREGETSSSKTRLLFRQQESPNKAQLEFIAYKTDSGKFLVIGSHKVAKEFMIKDSIYYFDVASIYSRVRGDDFIRQLGDLSIYFTHIPASACETFMQKWEGLKTRYNQATPGAGETMYFDYTIAEGVFVSLTKTDARQLPDECTLWVGKRKHEVKTEDLVKVMSDLKFFN